MVWSSFSLDSSLRISRFRWLVDSESFGMSRIAYRYPFCHLFVNIIRTFSTFLHDVGACSSGEEKQANMKYVVYRRWSIKPEDQSCSFQGLSIIETSPGIICAEAPWKWILTLIYHRRVPTKLRLPVNYVSMILSRIPNGSVMSSPLLFGRFWRLLSMRDFFDFHTWIMDQNSPLYVS